MHFLRPPASRTSEHTTVANVVHRMCCVAIVCSDRCAQRQFPRLAPLLREGARLRSAFRERSFARCCWPPSQSSFSAKLDFLTHKTVISLDVAPFSRSSMVEYLHRKRP